MVKRYFSNCKLKTKEGKTVNYQSFFSLFFCSAINFNRSSDRYSLRILKAFDDIHNLIFIKNHEHIQLNFFDLAQVNQILVNFKSNNLATSIFVKGLG